MSREEVREMVMTKATSDTEVIVEADDSLTIGIEIDGSATVVVSELITGTGNYIPLETLVQSDTLVRTTTARATFKIAASGITGIGVSVQITRP